MKMPQWPVPGSAYYVDLGLSRILELLERLGNPHLKLPPVIHVAGTNGKGSTVAFMRAMLESEGLKVHVHTSPHLVEFNERYIVASEQVADDMLNAALEECRVAGGDDLDPTFFEAITAAAFVLFAQNDADVVLLETGLGGRLDATNVVPKPLATVITPVSFDHVSILGDTIGEIAGEKAGIIKAGVPCFVAAQRLDAMVVLRTKAAKLNAEFVVVDVDESLVELGLAGEHQKQNAALASAVVRALNLVGDEAVLKGLKDVKWRARLQVLTSGDLVDKLPTGAELWLDGGHNPAAGQAISSVTSGWQDASIYIICGMIEGKDVGGFINAFAKNITAVYTVTVEDHDFGCSAQELALRFADAGVQATPTSGLTEAVDKIVYEEKGKFRILICGSLYLAGTVLASNT
jgi:dihydrofolate synthase/folylpolyglutamate synthase